LSHEYILEALTNACPGDAVLSEEGPDDHARLSADRVWIVDPLDGTREYVEPGRTDWAVHIALWERWTIERSGPTRVPDYVKGRPTPRIGCCRSDVMPASAGASVSGPR
jgi:fructose-1,6-bisphosphatase/inositol monophosphatase family enzyme